MITPTIWTIVVSRYNQSSVSYALANQLKFIHAHHTTNVANANPTRPEPMWFCESERANSEAAVPNATTNVKSKSNSKGVATRNSSRGSRPDIWRSR